MRVLTFKANHFAPLTFLEFSRKNFWRLHFDVICLLVFTLKTFSGILQERVPVVFLSLLTLHFCCMILETVSLSLSVSPCPLNHLSLSPLMELKPLHSQHPSLFRGNLYENSYLIKICLMLYTSWKYLYFKEGKENKERGKECALNETPICV